MEAKALLSIAKTVHGAVFAGGLFAYYQFYKSIETSYEIGKGFDDSVDGMRRSLTKSLTEELRPILKGGPIEIVFSGTIEAYSERPSSSPLQSEEYQTAVGKFIATHHAAILDYQIIRDFCRRHSLWLHRTIWVIWFVIVWSLSAFIGILWSEFSETPFVKPWQVITSLAVAGSAILLAVLFQGARHFKAGQAIEVRGKYESL